MVSRKYVGDYRLENRTNPKTGKVSTVPVYRGDWFAFCADAQTVRRMKRLYPILSLLCALLLLLTLTLNAPSGHAYYVSLPFVALIPPVYLSLAGSWRIWTAKARLTREHSDKLQPRFASCSLFITAFSAVSAAGHVLYAVREGFSVRDGVSLIAMLGVLACGIVMFRNKDRLKTKKVS